MNNFWPLLFFLHDSSLIQSHVCFEPDCVFIDEEYLPACLSMGWELIWHSTWRISMYPSGEEPFGSVW